MNIIFQLNFESISETLKYEIYDTICEAVEASELVRVVFEGEARRVFYFRSRSEVAETLYDEPLKSANYMTKQQSYGTGRRATGDGL